MTAFVFLTISLPYNTSGEGLYGILVSSAIYLSFLAWSSCLFLSDSIYYFNCSFSFLRSIERTVWLYLATSSSFYFINYIESYNLYMTSLTLVVYSISIYFYNEDILLFNIY